MHCTMVPREHVNQVWEQIKDYLEGAAEYTHGRYSVDDIFDSIMDYDHTLWMAFDEEGIKGAVVTNFMFYPRKHFAHDTYCDGIEATARPGWAKIFQGDGHKPLWQTFQLPAADAGLGVQNG